MLRHDRFGLVGIAAFAFADYASALTQEGALEEAVPAMREAVANELHVGTLWEMFPAIALLAFKRGRPKAAALIMGRFDVMVAEHPHTKISLSNQRVRDTVRELLRNGLPEAEHLACLTQGAALSDEDAARLALTD
jgi:hypothetical protein